MRGENVNKLMSLTVFLSLLVILLQMGCSIPRHIWREDDVVVSETGDVGSGSRVLVASGESDFKEAVIARIRGALESERVYLSIIGLSELEKHSVEDYDAVVLINRCVAWGMDPRVDGFLEGIDDFESIIVLTTSGDGNWLPNTTDRSFDAISAASEQALVDETADEIISRVLALLEGPP